MDEDRHRIRCSRCELVQFVNSTKTCRRCKSTFVIPKPAVKIVEAPIAEEYVPAHKRAQLHSFDFWFAVSLYLMRDRSGLSQRQMAFKMGVPRTYVSKVENAQATPTIPNMFRICQALGGEPAYLMRMTEFLSFGE